MRLDLANNGLTSNNASTRSISSRSSGSGTPAAVESAMLMITIACLRAGCRQEWMSHSVITLAA
ncbi:hypothetical protein D3C79_930010 [compost metagenome]